MQSKEAIEKHYATPDPWGYKTNPSDLYRKQFILHICQKYGPFESALDIGAGEGWITSDLPAKKIDAIELSDAAASRFPRNVLRIDKPMQTYDLVLTTGVYYAHYDLEFIDSCIREANPFIWINCGVFEWLADNDIIRPNSFRLKDTSIMQIERHRFPYLSGGERLDQMITVYEFAKEGVS